MFAGSKLFVIANYLNTWLDEDLKNMSIYISLLSEKNDNIIYIFLDSFIHKYRRQQKTTFIKSTSSYKKSEWYTGTVLLVIFPSDVHGANNRQLWLDLCFNI